MAKEELSADAAQMHELKTVQLLGNCLCFDAGSCMQSQDHKHTFLNHSRTRSNQSYINKM